MEFLGPSYSEVLLPNVLGYKSYKIISSSDNIVGAIYSPSKEAYYITDSGNLIFCRQSNMWITYNPHTVVELITKTRDTLIARFNPILNIAVYTKELGVLYFVSKKEAITLLGDITLSDNIYYPKETKLTTKNLQTLAQLKRALSGLFVIDTTHKANKNNPTYRLIEEYYSRLNIEPILPIFNTLAHILQDKTFGFEFETSQGRVPPQELIRTALVPVIDGSLPEGAYEYCTLPLSGTKGLQTLYEACNLLNKHTQVNTACSLHLNISIPTTTREFIVSLYLLYERLQEEILDFLPAYIENPVAIARKQKMYADRIMGIPYPNKPIECLSKEEYNNYINSSYAILFKIFTGKNLDRNFNTKSTKSPWGENTWRISSRYTQLNLLPLFIGNSKRIEFRVHPPTSSPTKVFVWLIICATIINYAQNNIKLILNSRLNNRKITLNEVLSTISSLGLLNGYRHTSLIPIEEYVTNYVNTLSVIRMEQKILAISTANNSLGGTETFNRTLMKIARVEFEADTLPETLDVLIWVNIKVKLQNSLDLN